MYIYLYIYVIYIYIYIYILCYNYIYGHYIAFNKYASCQVTAGASPSHSAECGVVKSS